MGFLNLFLADNFRMKKSHNFLFLIVLLPSLLWAQGTDQTVASIDGFAEASWGMTFESIREKFLSMATNPESKEQIEIINEKKDEKLLIKRNGIFISTGFIKPRNYSEKSDPKTTEGNPIRALTAKQNTEKQESYSP